MQMDKKTKKRRKRGDSKMKDNCSSHETGLGMAYYSLVMHNYIRNLN